MSEASESTSETTETETDSTEESASGGGKRTEGMQKALTAEREKRQALEQRLAEIEAAQKKRDEEAAAKRGEFEKLYTELKAETDPLREKLTAYQQREQARTEALNKANAEALEALPEDLRGLVPDGLNPEAKAAQIRKVAAMVGEAPSGGFAPRKSVKDKPKIPQACIDSAKHHNREPEQWFPIWKRTKAGREWLAKQNT